MLWFFGAICTGGLAFEQAEMIKPEGSCCTSDKAQTYISTAAAGFVHSCSHNTPYVFRWLASLTEPVCMHV